MAPKGKIIAGNWKMFKTGEESKEFFESFIPLVKGTKEKVFLAVPFTALSPSTEAVKGSGIQIGAQNMNDASEGAFTGEIAASMIKECGASFVILGHSERRQIFGETSGLINQKVKKAIEEKITPIVCVGETLEEKDGGKTEEVLKQQLEESLAGLEKEAIKDLIVAYEPVWAIGTGKTATPEDVENTHQFIRKTLESLFGKRAGGGIPLLYGGSVKPKNAHDLLSQKTVDGVLVGGASLKAEDFAQIVNFSKTKVGQA